MADKEIIHERSSSLSTSLVWLAVVLSVIAIVLAWIAYNRTGEDLESKIQDQINETSESIENQVQNETPDVNQ